MSECSVRGTTLRSLAEAARETMGEDLVDALLAETSAELRGVMSEGDAEAWVPARHHVELLAVLETAREGAARDVSDRAIARGLRGASRTLLPKLSPSCVAQRLHAIVAEHADGIRLELQERTLVSARWRAELRLDGEALRAWLLGLTRGAMMAAGSPEASAELVVADGIGDLRVHWA